MKSSIQLRPGPRQTCLSPGSHRTHVSALPCLPGRQQALPAKRKLLQQIAVIVHRVFRFAI